MKANPSCHSTLFRRSLLSGILLAAASSAQAQTTFHWDADGDATTGTGGPGIWDAASSLWRNGIETGPLAPWPNTDPAVDTAQFAGTAGKVTLNSDSVNLNITRIVFATTGYEIAGPASGTATLNVSGASPSRITATRVSVSDSNAGSNGNSSMAALSSPARSVTRLAARKYVSFSSPCHATCSSESKKTTPPEDASISSGVAAGRSVTVTQFGLGPVNSSCAAAGSSVAQTTKTETRKRCMAYPIDVFCKA